MCENNEKENSYSFNSHIAIAMLFHQFWEQLDQNQTVANAFTFASNFIPWRQWAPLIVTQSPLMHDNLGINTTWSFNSDPSL
jgi:maltoporin